MVRRYKRQDLRLFGNVFFQRFIIEIFFENNGHIRIIFIHPFREREYIVVSICFLVFDPVAEIQVFLLRVFFPGIRRVDHDDM